MKIQFIFCIAALLCAACAQKEAVIESGEIEPENTATEQEEVKTGFPYTLTASFAKEDETPATKVEFTNPTPADPASATWSVSWSVGDVIYVANQVGSDKSVAYEVESVTDGVATFKLKDGEDLSKFSEATTYYAGFGGTSAAASFASPYLSQIAATGGLFVSGYATYKSIVENTINNDFFLAFGAGSISDGKLNLQFHNFNCYIRLTIPEGMAYDVGEIYFSTSGLSSGILNVRFTESGIVARSKNNGGSNNAPFYYGSGTEKLSTPYPAFKPGVYYFPLVPGGNITGIKIYDKVDNEKCSRTFTISKESAWGKILDFGTIPTTADE